MRGRVSRSISLTVPNEILEEYLNKLRIRVRYIDMYVKTRLNHIKITFYGTPEEVQRAAYEARRLLGELTGTLKPTRSGFFRYRLDRVLSEAELKVAIPLELLEIALSLSGYETKIVKGYVMSRANYRLVLEMATKISKVYYESLKIKLPSNVRRLVVLYSLLKDRTLEESIEDLLRRGLLVKGRMGIAPNKDITQLHKILEEELRSIDSKGKG
ncbi:MAG: hypothetical protein DRJ49_05875 [Thermoprotei archaeon]|nr:MAG: hypothetical protein DRJ49_05875 [Thermoprotei archaeon]